MIQADSVSMAAQALLAAAPGSQVILFGSQAKGTARSDSDMDFVVIEPTLKHRRLEMVRLCDVLRNLGIYADVIAVSASDFRKWSAESGTIFHEAATSGRVFGAH